MTVHAFVDETKDRGYLVAATLLHQAEVSQARRLVSSLVMPGQRRVHFAKESDSRRRQIVDQLAALPVEVVLYDASSRHRRDQREACLRELVADLAVRGASRLVLERDDSIAQLDQRILFQAVRKAGCESTLSYVLQRAHEEALLAIPDAVAWCWARGGSWKIRVDQLVDEVHVL